jgi:hypothetical protein
MSTAADGTTHPASSETPVLEVEYDDEEQGDDEAAGSDAVGARGGARKKKKKKSKKRNKKIATIGFPALSGDAESKSTGTPKQRADGSYPLDLSGTNRTPFIRGLNDVLCNSRSVCQSRPGLPQFPLRTSAWTTFNPRRARFASTQAI